MNIFVSSRILSYSHDFGIKDNADLIRLQMFLMELDTTNTIENLKKTLGYRTAQYDLSFLQNDSVLEKMIQDRDTFYNT